MATYKVIQDIEAEDKLLGPLSLRQFIYAALALVLGYVAFRFGLISPLLAIPFLPPLIFFGALAIPYMQEQPTEVWLLAKIRFFLKPRRRVWDQDGIQELVTVTAPKQEEHQLTKDLSQTEVKSRLKALANTIDSRGWAVKNVDVNLFTQPAYGNGASDRLIAMPGVQQNAITDVGAVDDMLDERYNPTAQNLDRMINASSQAHRQQVIEQMKAAPQPQPKQQPVDYWFMNQTQAPDAPGYTTAQAAVVTPGAAQQEPAAPTKATTEEERELLEKIHKQKAKPEPASAHMRTILPLGQQPKSQPPAQTPEPPKKQAPDPAIYQLASNDDLNVETIARQANKRRENPDDEVVISLH